MEFSERLKSLRLEAGLTQKEISEKLSISQPQYARWEAGKRSPTSETLQKFADFFDVSTDYLLGKSDFKHGVDQFEGVQILFRNKTKNMTDKQKEEFRKELEKFMEERAEAIREWEKNQGQNK